MDILFCRPRQTVFHFQLLIKVSCKLHCMPSSKTFNIEKSELEVELRVKIPGSKG